MSLRGRPFVWQCDICGKVAHKEGYGLPRGWKWYTVRVEHGVKHKCEEHEGYPDGVQTNQDKHNG